MHLALANKGPVALDYAGLQAKARGKGLLMRYEATVMAGTPTMHLAEDALAGCEIRSARGILNGTTNFILTQMESGHVIRRRSDAGAGAWLRRDRSRRRC